MVTVPQESAQPLERHGGQARRDVHYRPAAARFGPREAFLSIERDDVTKVRVQFLTAGQAPRSAHHLVAAAADPEPGRVCHAVDAYMAASARLHAGFLPGQLFLRWRRQAVHRSPELVTSGAA